MKTVLISLATLILLSGCASIQKDAWLTYCNKYQINPYYPTSEQENYYLDCYLGSYEQENDTKTK